jgi:hypothetical protein
MYPLCALFLLQNTLQQACDVFRVRALIHARVG